MEYVSELTILQYLQTTIENYLSTAEDNNVVVSIDPDAEISLVDTDNQATPTIIIELSDTETIDNAVLGQATNLLTRFKISVMTAKEVRKTYVENKTRNVNLVSSIRLAFEQQTENKVDWDAVDFYDFPFGDIPAMIAIITVTTFNRSYDYSTT